MNIESLKYFSEVAVLKSISKVADKSHISQPALSNQLLKLESELGVKLLERSNKGVKLTEYGEIVLNFSKGILNYHNNLMKEINNKKNESNEVKIAVANVESSVLLSKFCFKIIDLFKDTNIIIDSNYKDCEHGSLINNSFDAIIGKNIINDKDVYSKYLGSDKFVLVSKEKININKLEKSTIIAYDDEILIENLLNMEISKNIKLKTNSLKVIKEYLKQNNSIAFLPRIAIEEEIHRKELFEINNKEYEISYDFYISYRKNIKSELKEKIKELRDYLKENLSKAN